VGQAAAAGLEGREPGGADVEWHVAAATLVMEELVQNLSLSVPLNLTAVLAEAQAQLDPVCEAAGLANQGCTLQNAALAIGLGAVFLLRAFVPAAHGDDGEPGKKKKTSSESDDEREAARSAAAAGKPELRPSRPPERYADSSEDEGTNEESGNVEAAAKNDEQEDGEVDAEAEAEVGVEEEGEQDDETEEGLSQRRKLIMEGRPARMKAAIDELTALSGSDDVAQICDALRKHAGKPADCRPAWLALQARLRTLVEDSTEGTAGSADPEQPSAPSGTVETQENPACADSGRS